MSYEFTPQEVLEHIENDGLYGFLEWGFDTSMLLSADPQLTEDLDTAKKLQVRLDLLEDGIRNHIDDTYEEENND